MVNKNTGIGLVCIGNELFYDVVNTNLHIASRICGLIGFEIGFNIIVPDDIEKIISAVDFCLKNTDIIILSGGLGPTFDDITKEVISKYTGKNLVFSSQVWEEIQKRFKERRIENIPEKNKKQAMVIEGAVIISNSIGTAPGMLIKHNNKLIFLLPGPPVEFEEMLKSGVVPALKENIYYTEFQFVRKSFNIAGEPETIVEEKTEKIRNEMKTFGAEWTILAKPYLIELWLKIPYQKQEVAEYAESSLKEIFQESFIESYSISEALACVLKEQKLVCCFAESCTGGLAGHLMTEISGISQWFNGSIVAYSNKVKKKILKVPKTILKKYGAVSEETAVAMAKGARKYGKADISLAITGIAGPLGGTTTKPIGLVWVAAAITNRIFETKKFYFLGNRSTIKLRAALAGIDFLRRAIIKNRI